MNLFPREVFRNQWGVSAMKQQWGRESSAGEWPSGKAVWTIGAAFVALVAAGAISAYRYARVWTPLERNYLTAYLASDAGEITLNGPLTSVPANFIADETSGSFR
jgi:hypothetical protein